MHTMRQPHVRCPTLPAAFMCQYWSSIVHLGWIVYGVCVGVSSVRVCFVFFFGQTLSSLLIYSSHNYK